MRPGWRADVVREAREWIGTRYHTSGRIKVQRDAAGKITEPGGADCCSLVVCVYEACGLIDPVTLPHYPPDWHLHRADERYLSAVLERSREIDVAEVQPGDLLLFRVGRAFAHGAIVIDPGWPHIIHAVWSTRLIHEGRADQGDLAERPPRAFTLEPG
jgi:cell wall-associated NlpC family hydrolase